MTEFERIKAVITYLETHHTGQPDLATLAKVAQLSEFHFNRLFKRWAGITSEEFLKFLSREHAKKLLTQSRNSTLPIPSQHLAAIQVVTSGEFKSKGKGIEITYGTHSTPFGPCLIGLTDRGICYLAFETGTGEDLLSEIKEKWSYARLKRDQKKTKIAVENIFTMGKKKKEIKKISLLLMGTPFQVKVWQTLRLIPEGHVLTYGDIAKLMGAPAATRAVATAIGSNAISWLIPCHRVICESAAFHQYRWRPERKKAMLAWEAGKKKAGINPAVEMNII